MHSRPQGSTHGDNLIVTPTAVPLTGAAILRLARWVENTNNHPGVVWEAGSYDECTIVVRPPHLV